LHDFLKGTVNVDGRCFAENLTDFRLSARILELIVKLANRGVFDFGQIFRKKSNSGEKYGWNIVRIVAF
jgi:hypothetical protein